MIAITDCAMRQSSIDCSQNLEDHAGVELPDRPQDLSGDLEAHPGRRRGPAPAWNRCRALPVIAALIVFHGPGFTAVHADGPVETVLFETIFGNLYDPAILSSPTVPAEVKARIRTFQKRAKAFRSHLPPGEKTPGPERWTHEKRVQVERGIVALIAAKGIEQEARGFALQTPLAYEWEGMSDCPLAEAAFAAHYIETHPRTPLGPYLKLFLAHRYRCAFEILVLEHRETAAIVAARNYQTWTASAMADPDPLVRFLAADIEKRPFLYLKIDSAPLPVAGERPAALEEFPETSVSKAVSTRKTIFTGEVKKGETFVRTFGSGLVFRLEPTPLGWTITVREPDSDEDLARLTPPFHFVPNPREIEGWHFRNEDNTGPNETGEKNVNAPGEERQFIFSPEVGHSIQGTGATTGPTDDEVAKVRSYGRGVLKIIDYRMNNLEPSRQAGFEWLRFEVTIFYPGQGSLE